MAETSVIMTSYNYSSYIGEAIESVLAQTTTDWELIIVDDGSTDNSLEIIQSYSNRFPDKISYFTHQNRMNLGIKATNELAFSKISGTFTAFLESDDVWRPHCLEKKISALKLHDEVILTFSDLELIGEKNSQTHLDYLDYCLSLIHI